LLGFWWWEPIILRPSWSIL